MHTSSTINENWRALIVPLQSTKFRWLLGVFAISGIAAAIPATLFLFFATDRLLLAQYAGLFLVIYFAAAALALPLWAMLSKRIGEARAWLVSMLLSVIGFVWAWQLAAGALYSFAVICIFSGAALGADLALPPALLAGVINSAGHSGQREGAYFGLWNWMTKMNLALAAGIALPLLDYLGYTPGRATEPGLTALGITYALLPCALKLTAAALLWRAPLREV
jgi:Na+/melibiose symporter-like transporter